MPKQVTGQRSFSEPPSGKATKVPLPPGAEGPQPTTDDGAAKPAAVPAEEATAKAAEDAPKKGKGRAPAALQG